MKTIALIFDFDDTLLPDSTTALLENYGIESKDFWGRSVKELIRTGYEPALAYLNRILENVGEKKALGLLRNEDLRSFGKSMDSCFYPGLNSLFKELRENTKSISNQIEIEFYILSGGLQDLIEGSPFVQKNFSAVYGCQFGESQDTGAIHQIKRCVTFTEKTRYLFEINKGIRPVQVLENQYIVNKDVPIKNRRVPFKNMIYVGDGLTDIPCFSLVKKMGGIAFGVFNPQEQKSAKRALLEFLNTDRVVSMHAPKYRKTDELGSLLRAATTNVANKIKLESQEAESD